MSSQRSLQITKNLCKRGIATIRFNLPGHGNGREKSEGSLKDYTTSKASMAISSVFEWLEKQEQIDAGRLGICAVSLGGSATIKFLANYQKICCVAFICTRADFKPVKSGLYSFTDENDERVVNRVLLKDGRRFDFYQLAKTIQAPTLIVHGRLDGSVPLEQAEKLAEVIENTELHVFEEGDHALGEFIPQIVDLMGEFFSKNLKAQV